MRNPIGQTASLLRKTRNDPDTAGRVIKALLRGTWYIARYSLFSRRIKISFPFKAYGLVTLKGPGTVSIGQGCSVYWNLFDGLTVVTLSKNAHVSIGKCCGLGGLTIRCSTSVTLGDHCLTANSLVQDGFLLNKSRGNVTADAAPRPVVIGDNVWLCGQTCVLKGSRIGTDGVLARGSLILGSDIGEFHLALGNPSSATMPIDRLLAFKVFQ